MTADTIGGVWTYAIELTRNLKSRGIEVAIATMGAPLSPDQRSRASEAGVEIYESYFKLEWMEDPWRDIDAAGEWLLDIERRWRPDLIHLNSYAHGALAWTAPTLVVGHSCVFSWWRAVHGEEPPPAWSEYRKRIGEGLRAANSVAAVSRAMLRELEHSYDAPVAGSVIYNGHRPDFYAPERKEPFVLCTGRLWDSAKNIAALDAAAASIQWPVYVAGEARHPEGGCRVLQHAHSLGYLSPCEARSWFARAAVYALPALYEPFGLSVLEAALSGCALVLGDIPSLREIWGNAAVFVPPSNTAAIAREINALIGSPTLRHELGRRAQTRARGFTADRMTQSYLDMYRSIALQSLASRSEEGQTTCAS